MISLYQEIISNIFFHKSMIILILLGSRFLYYVSVLEYIQTFYDTNLTKYQYIDQTRNFKYD